ncbi:MAG TPA: substrate-binding domain-containing protein, partial [Burkholderiales bacterium]|nr:substrate-binding domain-containing protein [Burkholderiales bacterium]
KYGNLKAASDACSLSYRRAWDVVRDAEGIFGTAIVEMKRGKGTVLTPFGKKLLWGEKKIIARLGPLLESMASELESELESVKSLANPVLHMYASHGFAVAALYAQLKAIDFPIELDYRGSVESVRALKMGDCDIAGFHVPLGVLENRVFGQFSGLLDQNRHCLINLASRRLGLIVPKGNPLGFWSIRDIGRENIQFVNRQAGSGTRVIIELMLESEGIDFSKIRGYDRLEFTHAAVAAYVASGRADVGVGVEPAARQFDLDFIPILTERYFLGCSRESLETPKIDSIIAILMDRKFKSEVNQLPGYDALDSGTVFSLEEAFPSYFK